MWPDRSATHQYGVFWKPLLSDKMCSHRSWIGIDFAMLGEMFLAWHAADLAAQQPQTPFSSLHPVQESHPQLAYLGTSSYILLLSAIRYNITLLCNYPLPHAITFMLRSLRSFSIYNLAVIRLLSHVPCRLTVSGQASLEPHLPVNLTNRAVPPTRQLRHATSRNPPSRAVLLEQSPTLF